MWSIDELTNAVDQFLLTHGVRQYDWTVTLGKPLLFAAGTSAAAFAGAAIWRYESGRRRRFPPNKHTITTTTVTTTTTPKRRIMTLSDLKTEARQESQPGEIVTSTTVRHYISDLHAGAGRNVLLGIIIINGLVYAAWLVPAWSPYMVHFFTSHTSRPPFCFSLLSSSISHRTVVHYAVNMLGLAMFGSRLLRDYNTPTTAGLISAWASRAVRIALGTGAGTASLGASGVVSAALAASIVRAGDSMRFLFLALGMELLGLCSAQPWYADYGGHLGGLLFGTWFGMEGAAVTHSYQAWVTGLWSRFRSNRKRSYLLVATLSVAAAGAGAYYYGTANWRTTMPFFTVTSNTTSVLPPPLSTTTEPVEKFFKNLADSLSEAVKTAVAAVGSSSTTNTT